jgi:hypothetical protein
MKQDLLTVLPFPILEDVDRAKGVVDEHHHNETTEWMFVAPNASDMHPSDWGTTELE